MKIRSGIIGGQARGAGDVLAEIFHATRIDKLAENYTRLTGRDCGCKARQEKLNQLFPFASGTQLS